MNKLEFTDEEIKALWFLVNRGIQGWVSVATSNEKGYIKESTYKDLLKGEGYSMFKAIDEKVVDVVRKINGRSK